MEPESPYIIKEKMEHVHGSILGEFCDIKVSKINETVRIEIKTKNPDLNPAPFEVH